MSSTENEAPDACFSEHVHQERNHDKVKVGAQMMFLDVIPVPEPRCFPVLTSVNLRPSGDAGFQLPTDAVEVVVPSEPFNVRLYQRSRSHNTHVAFQYVDELRQFV
jgi:hypothetical protein